MGISSITFDGPCSHQNNRKTILRAIMKTAGGTATCRPGFYRASHSSRLVTVLSHFQLAAFSPFFSSLPVLFLSTRPFYDDFSSLLFSFSCSSFLALFLLHFIVYFVFYGLYHCPLFVSLFNSSLVPLRFTCSFVLCCFFLPCHSISPFSLLKFVPPICYYTIMPTAIYKWRQTTTKHESTFRTAS